MPVMRCLILLLGVIPGLPSAQDVGRDINWQTPGEPNYQESTIPVESIEPFRLPDLAPAEEVAGRPLSEEPALFVRKIVVRGVTALDPSDIQTLTAPYENRDVSSADLQELRMALSRLYIEREYVNSGVILPDQKVDDGVVYYQAIEGNLTRIEIDDEVRLRDRYITRRIERHVDGPLNLAELQYALQHLQRDVNVSRLDARLAPGDEPGESVLRLAIDEPERFELAFGANNHRATSTGAEYGALYMTSRNLTGLGEVLRASTGLSDGADDVTAALSVPVSRRDTELQLYYSRTDSQIIEDRFETLDIESQTDTWGLALTQPVFDRLDNDVSITLGFETRHSETMLLGVPFSFSPGAQDGESDTRAVQFGMDWVNRGADHVLAMRGTYRRGIDVLNATKFEPRTMEDRAFNPTGADGLFTLYQFQAQYLHRLNAIPSLADVNDRAQVAIRTAAQLSNDPLLALEKVPIGGVNTVRGYPENMLVRDNGVSATLEFQLPVPGYRSTPHPLNLVVVPFVDYGRSWDEVDTDPVSDLRNTDDVNYILSAGLGLIWEPLRGLQSRLFWGADIGDHFDGDDPRRFRDSDLQDEGIHFAIVYSVTL